MLVSSSTPHDILIQLAQHTGLFALLALVFSQIIHASRLHRSRWRPVFLGGTFGAFAILCMTIPVTLGGGMIVDGRIVMTALSGMFGGPVAAVIAGVAAAEIGRAHV